MWQSPFVELQSLFATCFEQATASSTVICDVATSLGIDDFKAPEGWVSGFKQ
jgi:hypothetical protein